MTTPSESKAVPTDIELMAYFDGELDTERALEVERYLEAEGPARQKLDGLAVLGSWVRAERDEVLLRGSEPTGSSLDEGFTDAIMASVEAQIAGGEGVRLSPRTGGRAAASDATPSAASAERRAAPPSGPEAARFGGPSAVAPANDNARLLWGLVAAAAAAAAGLFLWGKGVAGLDDSQIARAVGVPVVSESVEPVAPQPSTTASPAQSDDDSTGVEIAAIDFGSATGAIYYVPNGDNLVGAATTTVVWLADE